MGSLDARFTLRPRASLDGGPEPFTDARESPRQQTMFAVGRIVLPERECVCLVRNISATGVGVEHDGALPIEVAVTIETRSMLPTHAIIRWSTTSAAGLEFLERPRMLTGTVAAARHPECTPRSPRFVVDRDADLIVGDTRVPTRISDVSLGGAKLRGGDDIPAIAPSTGSARLALRDTAWVLPGRIRWTRAATVGFQFVSPLTSQELAALLIPFKPQRR